MVSAQPRVHAAPCKVCGEERITQITTKLDLTNGLQITAEIVKQCGCKPEPAHELDPHSEA